MRSSFKNFDAGLFIPLSSEGNLPSSDAIYRFYSAACLTTVAEGIFWVYDSICTPTLPMLVKTVKAAENLFLHGNGIKVWIAKGRRK